MDGGQPGLREAHKARPAIRRRRSGPFIDHRGTHLVIGPDGGESDGGYPLTVTVTASVVWLGSRTALLCADPNTGTVRVKSNLSAPGRPAPGLVDITSAGARAFADYLTHGGTRRLVTLTPPAACHG